MSLVFISSVFNIVMTPDELCAWAAKNKMVLNADKCQVMHFVTAKKPLVLPDIVMDGKSLPIVTSTKLLGVTQSSDLSWQAHVDGIVKKSLKALYMIYVMKALVLQLVEIFIAYIRPLFSSIISIVRLFFMVG